MKKETTNDGRLVKTAADLADNAFNCSVRFTERIAQLFIKQITIIFIWLIALTLLVILKLT